MPTRAAQVMVADPSVSAAAPEVLNSQDAAALKQALDQLGGVLDQVQDKIARQTEIPPPPLDKPVVSSALSNLKLRLTLLNSTIEVQKLALLARQGQVAENPAAPAAEQPSQTAGGEDQGSQVAAATQNLPEQETAQTASAASSIDPKKLLWVLLAVPIVFGFVFYWRTMDTKRMKPARAKASTGNAPSAKPVEPPVAMQAVSETTSKPVVQTPPQTQNQPPASPTTPPISN